jgi:hypothetical protein
MPVEEERNEAVVFFSEAIGKWNRLIELYNTIRITTHPMTCEQEADGILAWFQENYDQYVSYSAFRAFEHSSDGKQIPKDPVFNVIFRGAHIRHICRRPTEFAEDLGMGVAFLRAHLASIKRKEENRSEPQSTLSRLERVLLRFHLAAGQLRKRRKNKTAYLIEDEYDVQDLLRAILRLDFDDIRSEEWTPSYAGGASKIDLVLKKEKVLIEVKKIGESLTEKQVGPQLIVDTARYDEYPDVETLVCFIYDPDMIISNPKGLQTDLEKLPTKKLKVKVTICPSP